MIIPEVFHSYLVLGALTFLVIALFRNWARPALLFLFTVLLFLLSGVLSPEEVLKGLSNKQIITIFLLIIVSSGLKKALGTDFFRKIFSLKLSPKQFLLRMMLTTSSMSAVLNNTPIVAFMIPYVKSWGQEKGYAASKLLIPLSFATILGGMITVIGTSTNMVLNGLIAEYGYELLGFDDFFYLGICVATSGIIYLYFFADQLLPERESQLQHFQEHREEYIVETRVQQGAQIIGKSVKAAGLRKLNDLFLVEILRKERTIAPVNPEEVIQEQDMLFFAGDTQAIASLLKENTGLTLSMEGHADSEEAATFMEVIIPVGSSLAGIKIKSSDFRRQYGASIVALHRRGRRISQKIGETFLKEGDLLLLLGKPESIANINQSRELLLLSPGDIPETKPAAFQKGSAALALALLLLGIAGPLDLFMACGLAITTMIISRLIDLKDIKNVLDLELITLLVGSLAIGTALISTGAGELVASTINAVTGDSPGIVLIIVMFVLTTLLTSLITNAAAVAMMFPIALEMATLSGLPHQALFLTIAFAASADFMTPIGYQTNLMVMGPGNYRFGDYFKLGFPLTLIYTLICITFIGFKFSIIHG